MEILNPQESIQYPEIAEEILDMAEEDQKMRAESFNNPEKWDDEVDKRNTARLHSIVEDMGWPTIGKVGTKASHKAWLLIQHADKQLDFQKLCLELMQAETPTEVDPSDIAFLEDRIRISEGRSQLYGTQFYTNPSTKVPTPWPIEDESHLDERRSAIGLEPFTEYQKGMVEKYKK